MKKQLQLTAMQWYEYLPEDLRDKAQAYWCFEKTEDLERSESPVSLVVIHGAICDNLGEALMKGFTWSHTVEGHDFWSEIAMRAWCGEFDKDI